MCTSENECARMTQSFYVEMRYFVGYCDYSAGHVVIPITVEDKITLFYFKFEDKITYFILNLKIKDILSRIEHVELNHSIKIYLC